VEASTYNRQHRPEDVVRKQGSDRNMKFPAWPTTEFPSPTCEGSLFTQYPPSRLQEALPFRGETGAIATAVEEAHIELRF